MPEEALTSFTVCDAYRYFVRQAEFLMSKSRSRREYLILKDNIIVLDHIFNLTKKSNFVGRLYYDLTQLFDNLGVDYFLGPPCRSDMGQGESARGREGALTSFTLFDPCNSLAAYAQ